MINLYNTGVYLLNGKQIIPNSQEGLAQIKQQTGRDISKDEAKKGTISYQIIQAHDNSDDPNHLKLCFDSLTSHDITYVGIIQTARASGLESFPLPYVLTNCHNSLCAVGGTINQDDHAFALSAAQKYGGIYVPSHLAVIHSYNREIMSKCGGMILGSDSHTRYGALGTMGIGEGGGELVKQLLSKTYDLPRPEIVGIYLTGKPQPGVGPQDVALTLIGKVFSSGFVTNKVMEFIGDGLQHLPVEYRNGIDVMTTETTCWSSIWATDEQVQAYYTVHGRPADYVRLEPNSVAYYDRFVTVDLGKIKPMIAMPFHPANVYSIEEVQRQPYEILQQVEQSLKSQFENTQLCFKLTDKIKNGHFQVDQGIIAGCSGGTYDNIVAAADILTSQSTGNGTFSLNIYPGSQPINMELIKNGTAAALIQSGAILREAFCGPCFGAGDTPANQEFSIRHTTRNFPNREGSKPTEGQISYVALMDARSIAATARNGGKLTAATELDITYTTPTYHFNQEIYKHRVYNGVGQAKPNTDLHFGPNIQDWPELSSLNDHLLLKVVSYITDPVTTTDELIPSGEISSYRSNPLLLAEYTLSRKDPSYVGRAKALQANEQFRSKGELSHLSEEVQEIYRTLQDHWGDKVPKWNQINLASTLYACKPGDGSAREQAASCQRILGGGANIAQEYATKRYRSNLINWGIIPFTLKESPSFKNGDYLFIPNIKEALQQGHTSITAYKVGQSLIKFTLYLDHLTLEETKTLIAGSLINYYK